MDQPEPCNMYSSGARLDVDVLHIESTHKISVRLKKMRELYYELEKELSVWCNNDRPDKLVNFNVGTLCCVKLPRACYRGKILRGIKNEKVVRVRLIDLGADEQVQKKDLYQLPQCFVKQRKCSFYVHLSQIPRSASHISAETIRQLLGKHSLSLIQRAKPEVLPDNKDGDFSLPCEIVWAEEESSDPFSLSVSRDVLLSQRLYKGGFVKFDILNNNGTSAQNFIETDYIENVEKDGLKFNADAFNDVNEKVDEKDKKFKWLNPLLPTSRYFFARGTHVDNAGQIYMHLNSGRREFRDLRTYINNQFKDSDPDCDPSSFGENEEVIAMWDEDQEWYRARFLGYNPDSRFALSWVFFVDWGNTCQIETKWVRRRIVQEVQPIFAFKTVLHNVLPSNSKDWSVDALDFIHEKINYGNKVGGKVNVLKVEIMSKFDRQPLLVDIKLYTPVEGRPMYISLSDLIIARGDGKEASMAQVDSKEHRVFRKMHDYGVRFKRLNREQKIERSLETNLNGISLTEDLFRPVPPMDTEILMINEGSLITCEVQSLLSWNEVVVHIGTKSPARTVFRQLVDKPLKKLASSEKMIPIPRKGMILAMEHDVLKWVRVEVLSNLDDEDEIQVSLMDFGTEEWVKCNPENSSFRKLPDEITKIACQSLAVHLPLGKVKSDEDEDMLLTLMTECILTTSESEQLFIRVRSVTKTAIHGHLLNSKGEIIYESLVKEKLILKL